MELYKDKNIEKSIRLRQEGKDCLSWIENFGLHLFDEKCMPRVSFNDGKKNEILVLRINKVQNIIYAYYCFFQTDSKGFSRFCVNKAESVDAAGLKDLMDRAKWEEDSTKNYWKEIFCGGKAHNVDETTLKRQETKTSPYYEMNMMEYIECIQKEIQKLLEKLCIPANENISKVLITEQYALAFPLKYALGRIFPNAKRTVYGCIQKIEEKSWKQNAAHFHISGKLLHSGLNTTPQMTIGDVLSLREKGVMFTLPLSKGESGEYCLPTTSVIENSELKWNELMTENIQPDYTVDNLAFKRVHLSVFADGFQNVYLNTHDNIVSAGISTNGKSIYINKSEAGQSPDNSVHTVPHKNNPMSNTDKETENGELIKNANLNAEIQRALTLTLGLLRQEAYFFIRKRYPNKTVGILFDEWIKNKRKNGGKYSQQLIENWEHYKRNHVDWEIFDNQTISDLNTGMLDYGNYYVFVEQNWDKLAEEWNRNNKLIIDQIREIRNMLRSDSSHQIVHNFEKETVMDLFTNMRNIAKIFDKKEVMDEIAKVRSRVYEMM